MKIIASSRAKRMVQLFLVPVLVWTAPASRSEEGLELRGRVVTDQGQGLPAARVTLERLQPLHLRAGRSLDPRGRLEPAASARTGPGGQFLITVSEPGFWRLTIRHRDHLPVQRDLSPLLVSADLGTVSLEPVHLLPVQLQGKSGEELAGVKLSARGWSERWRVLSEDGWWPADRHAESGADGLARVPCSRGERVSLLAVSDGLYAHEVVSCSEEEATLQLAEQMLDALVVDASGAAADAMAGFVRWPFFAFGRSDEEGRLKGPWRSDHPLPIAFADASGFYGDPQLGWTMVEGQKLAVFQLRPALSVTGRVVDALSGEPIPGAWLWLGRGSHHFHAVDAKGQFQWRVPAGLHAPLHAAAPGYLETEVHRLEGTDEWATVVFRLAPAMRSSGRIIDSSGRGVPGAEVFARMTRGVGPFGSTRPFEGDGRWVMADRRILTDGSGAFEIDRLPPHLAIELEISRTGYASRTVRIPEIVPGVPREDLEIVLEGARNGFGKVVELDDRPIAGAEVELIPALVGSGLELDFAGTGVRRTHTDAEGRFFFADLAHGTYYMASRGAGHPEVLVPGLEIEPGRGAIDLGTVVLAPGVRLGGRVHDTEGKALAGIDLQVRMADGDQIVVQRATSPWFTSATSNAEGEYELPELPVDRRLTLLVLGDEVLPEELAVTTTRDDMELDIELQQGLEVSGRVIAEGGAPVPGASVELSRTEPRQPMDISTRRSVLSGAEGRFAVSGLREGVYAIAARKGEAVADPLRLEVSGKGLGEVELELTARGVLEGRVTDPDDLPVAGVYARIEPIGRDETAMSNVRWLARADGDVSDNSGRFRIAGLRAGTYRVSANHRRLGSTSTEVTVSDEEHASVHLRFELRLQEPTFEISGRIVDEIGTPLEDVKITLSGAESGRGGGITRSVSSRRDGTFRLTAAAGQYRLVCRRSGFAAYTSRVFDLDTDFWDFAIIMSAGAAVVGTVAGLDLDDLARVVVVARGESDHHYGTINFEGEIHIPHLTPGSWTVRAELLNPTRAAWEVVEIAPGDDEVRVDLRFEAGFRVGGRAYRDGLPLVGGTVQLRCPGEYRAEVFTRDGGGFSIDHVPAGACSATLLDRRSGRRVRQELQVDGDLDIVLELLASDGRG